MSRLQCGVAVRTFDPGPGVTMAGFAARDGVSRGSHDPLSARAMVFTEDERAVALVVADLIGLEVRQADGLRTEIGRRLGIAADAVVIAVTHTHSGPQILREGLGGGADERVVALVFEAIIDAAVTAWNHRFPARIGHATALEHTVAHNRRHPDGPIDPVVWTIRVDDEHGRPRAALVSYACHPVVLDAGNLWFSGDWPAVTRDLIEAAHPGLIAVFAQGCCGDINTGHSAHDSMSAAASAARTFEEAERIGAKIAKVVLDQFADLPTRPEPLSHASACAELGFQAGPTSQEAAVLQRQVQTELASDPATSRMVVLKAQDAWLNHVGRWSADSVDCTVVAIGLGDLRIVSVPGEPFHAIADDIRRALPGREVLAVGYANGVPGYVPHPPTEYDHGGYEVEEAHYFWWQPHCFRPTTGAELVDAAVRAATRAGS